MHGVAGSSSYAAGGLCVSSNQTYFIIIPTSHGFDTIEEG